MMDLFFGNLALFLLLMILDYSRSIEGEAPTVAALDPCPHGAFHCGNDTQCVEQSLWCDKHQDCDNEYDESFEACHAPDGIKPSVFKGHVTLKPPTIGHVKTDCCDSTSYPLACTCFEFDKLGCQSLGFRSLPTPLPAEMTIAQFQRNHIKLQSEMFKPFNLSGLRYLYLDENSIEDIPNRTFVSLPQLGKLSLEWNNLTVLRTGMFTGLNQLAWLNLRWNRIRSIEEGALADLPSLLWLMLDYNSLTYEGLEDMVLPPNLAWLHMEKNQIQLVTSTTFVGAPYLRDLVLKDNVIDFITENAFNDLQSLYSLDLSHNKIRVLNPDMFYYNRQLQQISLAYNLFTELPLGIFDKLQNLMSLNFSGIHIENIHPDTFTVVKNLRSIHFQEFRYCRYAMYVRNCSPKSDGLSSFNFLLATPALRYIIWVVAIVTLVGNVAVIISRLVIKEQHRRHSMSLRNLAGADLMMGLYLIIIAVQDIRMYNKFNQEALAWVSSPFCAFVGIIAMSSSEVSLIILICMTAERFMAVVYPLRSSGFNQDCTWLLLAWVCGILLSVLPLLIMNGVGGFYGINGVCLPLHIHSPYRKGWEYSAFLFLGLNSVAYVAIAVFYVSMCRSIVKTRKSAYRTTHRSDHTIICRFTLIIVTNTMCWLPIAIIKLCALGAVQLPEDTHAWLTVLILPINSALNPLIHSLTTPPFIRLFLRSLDACCYLLGRRPSTRTTIISLKRPPTKRGNSQQSSTLTHSTISRH